MFSPRAFLLVIVAALAACDRPAESPAPSARPAPPSAPISPATASREFADDAAFATFAASIEPSFTPTIPALQTFRGGEWAVGFRRDKLNYILWPLDPNVTNGTYYLDAELGGAENTRRHFYNRDQMVRIAPDGSWGYFTRPVTDEAMRGELWRLPLKAGEEPARFHTFEETHNIIPQPSISDDGRLLLFNTPKGWSLFVVGAAEGKVTPMPLSPPDDLKAGEKSWITLELAGLGPMIHVKRQTDIGDKTRDLRMFIGVGSLAFTENPPAASIAAISWLHRDTTVAYRAVAVAPDGRHTILHDYIDDEKPAEIWRLPAAAGEKPALIGSLEFTKDGSVLAAWSRNGKRVAVLADDVLRVFDSAKLLADANAAPLETFTINWRPNDVAFSSDGSRIALTHRLGGTTVVPLDAPREIDAKIGEARIAWDAPRDPPPIEQWPALSGVASIKHTEGAPSTLIVDVTNNGAGHARQIRSKLTIAPPLTLAGTDPANPAQPIAQLGPLHHGTIGPTLSIKRYLDLPADPVLFTKARRFSVDISCKFGFNPAPIHWLHLPRTIKDEAEYHAMAKTVFEAGLKVIADARGKDFEEQIKLIPLEKTGFGFMASSGANVLYQNPFVMDDNALRVNRAVMQVGSQDELMRHGQMMLFWYLPHELVHCADSRTGWETEFVANTIQPYVTAKLLESMPDAPYTAQSMAFVYDRYVEKLRPHLKDEEIARIERFIQNNGEGEPPWNLSASDVFQTNTPGYVYFGARINQHSWAKQSKLADLCKQYLP